MLRDLIVDCRSIRAGLTLVICVIAMHGCSAFEVCTEIVARPPTLDGPARFGIAALSCDDKTLGASLSDALALALVRKGHQVVERTRLADVVAETDLADANIVDAGKRSTIRSLLPVDLLLFGTVDLLRAYDLGGKYAVIGTITIRIVDIKTGAVIMVTTYTRRTDYATEEITTIADRIADDIHMHLLNGD